MIDPKPSPNHVNVGRQVWANEEDTSRKGICASVYRIGSRRAASIRIHPPILRLTGRRVGERVGRLVGTPAGFVGVLQCGGS